MDQSRDRQILLRQEDQLQGISEWCLPLLLASRLLPKIDIYSEQMINNYLRFLLHLIVLRELELFELSIDDFDAEVFLDKFFFERDLLALVLLFFVGSVCFWIKCFLKNRYSVWKIYFYLKFLFGSDKVDVLGVILCEVDGLDRLDDLGNLKRVSLYINSGCGDSHFQKNKN